MANTYLSYVEQIKAAQEVSYPTKAVVPEQIINAQEVVVC